MNPTMKIALQDIEEDINKIARTLALTSDDHPNTILLFTCLVKAYRRRFSLLGELNDLQAAIEYGTNTIKRTPDDDPSMPDLLDALGLSHCQRSQRLGDTDDINQAIEYSCLAVALTSDGHPGMSQRLGNLAVGHQERYKRLGKLHDLEEAMQYESRAPTLMSDGHPHLPGMLANIGTSHSYRFQRLGEMNDLEKSIQYRSRAVDLTPDSHPHLSSWLSNLGTSHSYRFQRLGELNDLEQAIKYQLRALDLTPNSSEILDSLGTSHDNRFQRLGEIDDLEKSIQYRSRAVDLIPYNHPHLFSMLTNLGLTHRNRFERLGSLGDLEKAIRYQSRALDMTPSDHPHLSTILGNLGTSYNYRFQHLGQPSDIEKAIQHESRALDLTAEDHPDLSTRLYNLGMAHGHRFQHLGLQSDLEKTMEYESRALSLIPDDHPHLSLMHSRLATSYAICAERTGDISYLQHSLKSFRMASYSTASAPRHRFEYAREWAKLASSCTTSTLNPIEAYQATMNLLPQFIWLGATTDQRYKDLLTIGNLAVDAACAAILSSDYSLALEWLEHARCVVWSQCLMLRSPLDQLQSSHPTLAARLRTIAHQIHSASTEARESRALASASMSAEQVAQEHRRLAQEYSELIANTRMLPGFEDFLRPIKAHRIIRLARYGPIVLINCHQNRCDALVILPNQPSVNHIPLTNFTEEKAKRIRSEIGCSLGRSRCEAFGTERRPRVEVSEVDDFGTLIAVLWGDVVKPVLDFLGYTDNVQTSSLPHITWCPTGAMSFLPLHAAGDYGQPQSRVFDYAVSSYTPTLTALLESTPSSLASNSGVLAIGQRATPGHSQLPGTAMELASVKDHIQYKARYSQLIDHEATTTAVLDAMEQHDWVHLACHAHQNVTNATESGFFLHDGTLDLAAINGRSFKNKGLAFLSACQTAKGDETLPDEAVHLASGMLMAGYISVIATMWSVADMDAPVAADRVYARLMNDGKLGNGEAGRALHDAVGELRESVGEKQFERWVPYIHIGS